MSRGKFEAPKSASAGKVFLLIFLALLLVAVLGLSGWILVQKNRQPEMEQEPAKQTEAATEATTQPATEPPVTEPSQPTEPEQPEEPSKARQQAETILAGMTTEEKIYQLFVVTPEQVANWSGTVTQTGDASKKGIAERPVGGIIYFSPNLEDREQTIAMIDGVQEASKLGLFIAVDEEGGSVVRIADNEKMGTKWFPSMGEVGKDGDAEKAYEVGFVTGTDIKALGFNVDFAPVADVNSEVSNTVVGNRSFHSDPNVVADMISSCVKGFKESGVLCTLKHFPGHGDTSTDSHFGVAKSDKTLEELEACEFVPFRAGIEAGAPFIMIGHVTLPNVTEEDVPATLSHEIVTGLLREKLGYEGLIITDAMNMGAITNHYSSGESTVLALKAGVDMVLMPTDLGASVKAVQTALDDGTLTIEQLDEKVLRILETKIEAGIIVPE